MASLSAQSISTSRITTGAALHTLVQSFNGLPSNPASLYLSTNSQSLVIYVALNRKVNIISLSLLCQGGAGAATMKTFLEDTETTTKVFFDARMSAKVLFDRCGIKLANPKCTERAHIHEVQMMELALREEDKDRKWLCGLDECLSRGLDILPPYRADKYKEFDERILHLPALWKKYHDCLTVDGHRPGNGGAFWVLQIRIATRKRLAVAQGEPHRGYSVDSAKSAWDEDTIEQETESWNEDVMMDHIHNGEWAGGPEYWETFKVL